MPETLYSERWIFLQELCEYPDVKQHTILRLFKRCVMLSLGTEKLWQFKTADIDAIERKISYFIERQVIR